MLGSLMWAVPLEFSNLCCIASCHSFVARDDAGRDGPTRCGNCQRLIAEYDALNTKARAGSYEHLANNGKDMSRKRRVTTCILHRSVPYVDCY